MTTSKRSNFLIYFFRLCALMLIFIVVLYYLRENRPNQKVEKNKKEPQYTNLVDSETVAAMTDTLKEVKFVYWEKILSEISDQRLRAIFLSESNATVLPTGYKMTEGTAFAGSSGSYIVMNTDGGKVWLIDALLDSDMRINMLTAIAFASNEEWEKAVTEANKAGLRFPSPRIFRPNDFVQIQSEKLTFYGSHFSKYEK